MSSSNASSSVRTNSTQRRTISRQSSLTSPDTYTSLPVTRNVTPGARERKNSGTAGTLHMRPIPGTPPPPPPLPLPPIPTQKKNLQTQTRSNFRAISTATPINAGSPPPPPSHPHRSNTHTPEEFFHTIRDRSHEQYRRLRERPSVPLLMTAGMVETPLQRSATLTAASRSRSGSIKSAPAGPCINVSIVTAGKGGRGLHSIAGAPSVPAVPTSRYGQVPSQVGCLPGAGGLRIEDWAIFGGSGPEMVERNGETDGYESVTRMKQREISEGRFGSGDNNNGGHRRRRGPHGGLLGEMRQKVKHMLKGLHVTVSISFREREDAEEVPMPRQTSGEMTLRIRNSKTDSCIFEIIKHEDSGDEILTPIDDLKSLFPYNRPLQRSLSEWNHHYQNPPQHWVVNFIPRAYLKRGYSLAEEVHEYFMQHPDECAYRIEYEPIGHNWCLIGTVAPRTRGRKTSGRGGDMWWEGGKERYADFEKDRRKWELGGNNDDDDDGHDI